MHLSFGSIWLGVPSDVELYEFGIHVGIVSDIGPVSWPICVPSLKITEKRPQILRRRLLRTTQQTLLRMTYQ